MSLSKVYKNQDTFEPEDLITKKVSSEMTFGSIVTDRLPAKDSQAVENQNSEPASTAPASPAQTDCRDQPVPDIAFADASQNAAHLPPHRQSAKKSEPMAQGVAAEEVDRLVAEAYERGKVDGISRAEEDYGSAARTLLQCCSQLDNIRENIYHNSLNDIHQLVVAIAEKVIRASVADRNHTILATIEEAIQQAVRSEEFSIYIHPDDYETVLAKSNELVESISGLKSISIQRDQAISQGGCRIDSDRCSVDATLENQLDVIQSALGESVRN